MPRYIGVTRVSKTIGGLRYIYLFTSELVFQLVSKRFSDVPLKTMLKSEWKFLIAIAKPLPCSLNLLFDDDAVPS